MADAPHTAGIICPLWIQRIDPKKIHEAVNGLVETAVVLVSKVPRGTFKTRRTERDPHTRWSLNAPSTAVSCGLTTGRANWFHYIRIYMCSGAEGSVIITFLGGGGLLKPATVSLGRIKSVLMSARVRLIKWWLSRTR